MAPEQLRRREVDRRPTSTRGSCSGRRSPGSALFDAKRRGAPRPARGRRRARAPRELGSTRKVPPALDAIVAQAVEVDPAKRFATTLEMAQALDGGRAAGDRGRDRAVGPEARRQQAERARGEAQRGRDGIRRRRACGPDSGAPSGLSLAATAPAGVELDIPDLAPAKKTAPKPADKPAPAPSKPKAGLPDAPSFDDPFDDPDAPAMKIDLAVSFADWSPRRAHAVVLARRSRGSVLRAERAGAAGTGAEPVASRAGPAPVSGGRPGVGRACGAVRPAVRQVDDQLRRRRPPWLRPHGRRHRAAGWGDRALGREFTLSGVGDITMRAPEVNLGLDWQGNLQRSWCPVSS